MNSATTEYPTLHGLYAEKELYFIASSILIVSPVGLAVFFSFAISVDEQLRVFVNLSVTSLLAPLLAKQKVEKNTMRQHLLTAIDQFSSEHFLAEVC